MGLTSLIQPTGSGDSGAVGEVDSITNSDGTLTISPTTGAAVASLNVGNANVWTALQTFAAGILLGSDDTLAWGGAVGGGTADSIFSRIIGGQLRLAGADHILLQLKGNASASGLYFSNVAETNHIGANRNPISGAFDSASRTAPLIVLSPASGNGHLEFWTTPTDNAAPTQRWDISKDGYVLPFATNTYDIGSTALAGRSVYAGTSYNLTGANAQNMALKQLTELTTIAAAATTDTTIQIPANSLVLGVTVRVTTVIPTAATFDIGVAGATTRYGTGILVAAGTTNASPGTTNPTIYSSAVSIRITPNLTPADTTGRVRVTIHYLDLTPPTS